MSVPVLAAEQAARRFLEERRRLGPPRAVFALGDDDLRRLAGGQLTRGVAQSWEHVTDVVPNQSAKYYAIGKPLWSRAEGEHRLEPLPDGKTRVHFMERYLVVNPLMRLLLERRIHHFISKDNDRLVRQGIEQALAVARRAAPA